MNAAASAVDSRSAAPRCELVCELLREFGSLRFTASGWSMIPTIWPRETVVVEPVRTSQLEIGEIVLTQWQGALRAHRVVAKPKNSTDRDWITKGDAMRVNDTPMRESDILGRVSHLVRGGESVAIPRRRSKVNRLAGKIISRSFPAARALMYLRNRSRQDGQVLQKSILPCQS
jgi:hypothetical protein